MSQASSNISLTWKLSPIQRAFFESDARYRTLVGGRRFGKNVVGIASDADFCINPGAYQHGHDNPEDVTVWWIGPTYNQTRKYGFQQAKSVLPDELIASTRATQPFEIQLWNGATWEFYSYDRPKSLDGAGVDSITIDERGYMPDQIWEDNLAAMLLDTNGRAAYIGKPWTSDGFEEWYEKGQSPEHPEYASWQATSYDNPFIPDERIDELFSDLPDRIYRREVMAEFGAGGTLLTRDMLSYADATVLDGTDWQWHVFVDLGVEMNKTKARQNDTDFWALAVVAQHARKSDTYLCDIHRKRGQSPSEAAKWIKDCIRWTPTRTVRFESVQAQAWFENDLKDHNLNPVPVTPDSAKEDRILHMSVPFSNDDVQLLDWSDVPGKDVDWSGFISEWQAFPDGDHDDMLDAVAGALEPCSFGRPAELEGMDLYARDDE